jgi:hypothetical protein
MWREFENIKTGECLLCGSTKSLTGEHKIKASLLKQEFQDRPTVIAGKDAPKIAQSSKSKAYHFHSKICQHCNSTVTQPADRAFEYLHTEMKKLYDVGLDLMDDDNNPNCLMSVEKNANVFRYFAKILCCFLAEVGGPRPKSVAAFVLGRSERNPVHLQILKDDEYHGRLSALATWGFAGHGGLAFRFDDQKEYVRSIESSISVGGLKYEFWVQLNLITRLELNFSYPKLVQVARNNIV